MRIGVVGSGKIGATAARLFVGAGHQTAIANSRGPESLADLVSELGDLARAFRAGCLGRAARLDAVPDDQLAAVQARRTHAYEQLSRAGLGRGCLAQLESGRPRFGADPIRFHLIASRAAPVSLRMCMPVLARTTA